MRRGAFIVAALLTLSAVLAAVANARWRSVDGSDKQTCVAPPIGSEAPIVVSLRARDGKSLAIARFEYCGPRSVIAGARAGARWHGFDVLLRGGSCAFASGGRAYHVGPLFRGEVSANPKIGHARLQRSQFAVDLKRPGSTGVVACGEHAGSLPLPLDKASRTDGGGRPTRSARGAIVIPLLLPFGNGRYAITLTPAGLERTRVVVRYPSPGSGGTELHIRRGTCQSLVRGTEIPLMPLLSPSSTLVDLPLPKLVSGGFVIEVHTGPGLHGSEVEFCAALRAP